MKIRNGFVSNSSSSSFVIDTKGNPLIQEILDSLPEDSKRNISDLIEDLINTLEFEIKSDYEYDVSETKERLRKLTRLSKSDNLRMVYIDNEQEAFFGMIYTLHNKGRLEILEESP